MDGQAISPPQGLTETQAVDLLKQRRAAAQAPQPAKVEQPEPEEADDAPAETPSADDVEGQEVDNEQVDGDEQSTPENEDPVEEPTIRYVVDGKPQVASLKEAQEALASVKHLSRLRNEIVENHRKTQTETQEVQTHRQEVVGRLQELEQVLTSSLPTQADMQKMLDAGDTNAYLKAQQAHQRFAQVQQAKQQEAQRLEHERDAARQQREQQEAQELIKARPDFAKPDYVRKVVDYMQTEWGFDEAFISQLGSRELQIVDDARKWNEWNRNKSLGVKKAIEKSARPSAVPAAQPVDNKHFNALRETVRQGGGMQASIELMKMKRKMKG